MPQAPARRATGESSDVAKLVRLHHRRRGWAWVATGSAIGLVVYAGIDVNLFNSLTGTAETLSVITVLVLLALVLAGLIVVIVDTSRIHRADRADRLSAKGSVSHYPLYAHAHRWPPRHPASWVAIIVMLVAMTGITAYILPQEVNAWAYVAGAARVTWSGQVPLGQPFSVRDPLWALAPAEHAILIAVTMEALVAVHTGKVNDRAGGCEQADNALPSRRRRDAPAATLKEVREVVSDRGRGVRSRVRGCL